MTFSRSNVTLRRAQMLLSSGALRVTVICKNGRSFYGNDNFLLSNKLTIDQRVDLTQLKHIVPLQIQRNVYFTSASKPSSEYTRFFMHTLCIQTLNVNNKLLLKGSALYL